MGQKINFVEKHDVGVVKHGRIFERLVLALRYTQNDNLVVFTQIERSRTDQVAHILDQENIQVFQVKILNCMADHMGIQVAAGTGIDLPHRNPGCRNPHRVVVSLLIALDDGKAEFLPQVMQGTLKDGGFAGAGRADQIQHKYPSTKKEVSVFPCQTVVLGQDIGFDGNFPGSFRLAMAVGVAMIMMIVIVVVVVLMIVVMVFRGTTAYGTHGFSQPPFLSPAALHRI